MVGAAVDQLEIVQHLGLDIDADLAPLLDHHLGRGLVVRIELAGDVPQQLLAVIAGLLDQGLGPLRVVGQLRLQHPGRRTCRIP